MASAAEQLASNVNLGAFSKATELKKRIWFTLGALIVYRLGTFIPLPGIDPVVLDEIFRANQGGVLGMFNMFAGGALGRMTIFALNIMPYISASIIMQLMTSISPSRSQRSQQASTERTPSLNGVSSNHRLVQRAILTLRNANADARSGAVDSSQLLQQAMNGPVVGGRGNGRRPQQVPLLGIRGPPVVGLGANGRGGGR